MTDGVLVRWKLGVAFEQPLVRQAERDVLGEHVDQRLGGVNGALGVVLRQPDLDLPAVDPLHLPADVDLAAKEVDVGDLQGSRLAQPQAERVAVFDNALGLTGVDDAKQLDAILNGYYANTSLDESETRLALMDASVADLEASDDPFMKLAVALYDYERGLETESEARAGRMLAVRPTYMEAITDWQRSQGVVTYPDANSTLRVTYGKVLGGVPRDGMAYLPFTTLEGILEKDTGEVPFNAPAKQREEIRQRDYGPYKLDSIGSVPVNFLSDLDSTGGNSGSATLNSRAELVGLLFDGTFESVNSDWDFDPRTTRTIHVDTRYMLWVMDKVDGAQALIEEMDVVR